MNCQWYLLCDHAAVGHVEHPVLGRVPTCRRCAVTHDLDLKLDVAYVEPHGTQWYVHYASAVVGRHTAKYKAIQQADHLNNNNQGK